MRMTIKRIADDQKNPASNHGNDVEHTHGGNERVIIIEHSDTAGLPHQSRQYAMG